MSASAPVARTTLAALAEAAARQVIGHEAELCALDRAIGDGDHGVNMRRGAEAVLRGLPELAACSPGEALALVGRILVFSIGGASGPLFGTFFLAFGEALAEAGAEAAAALDLSEAFDRGVAAVMSRGRCLAGQKTMLDVLLPVGYALRRMATEGAVAAGVASSGMNDLAALRAAVHGAVHATRPMVARRGRAAFLGARSAGHVDPGARSAGLIVEAVCLALEGGR